MNEPKTDLALAMRKFMQLSPGQRDETLYLLLQEQKTILQSDNIRKLSEIMNGTTEEAGLPVRVVWLEEKVRKLTASNERLQRALYISAGMFAATKFFFAYIMPAINK